MGFDASVISGVVGFIEVEFELTKIELGWSVSSLALTATLAMMLAGPISDRVGRRPVLKIAALLFAAYATDADAQGLTDRLGAETKAYVIIEYGSHFISLEKKALIKMLGQVGETPLFYLKTEKDEELPVLIDELQAHSLSGEPNHISFKRVNLLEKVSSEIPVELVGENSVSGAVVVLTQDSIEVEALPADLPEKFEVDISKLTEVGQSLSYLDLSFDKDKVKLLIEEEKLEEPVVLLQEVKEEVIEEPVVEVEEGGEAAEGEAEDKKDEFVEGKDSEDSAKKSEEAAPEKKE